MKPARKKGDLPGAFVAVAREVQRRVRNASWAAITCGSHAVMRLDHQKRNAQRFTGSPTPVALEAMPVEGREGKLLCASRQGALLVGFARLRTTDDDTTLNVLIGRQEFGSVTLGHAAGAFVYALDSRFPIPLYNLRFHEVHVDGIVDDSIAIVYAHICSEEGYDLCVEGAWCTFADGRTAVFRHGMGGLRPKDFVSTDAPWEKLLVVLPDMTEIAGDDEAENPNPAVRVFHKFLTPAESEELAAAVPPDTWPRMVSAPESLLERVVARLDAAAPWGAPWRAGGERVALGETTIGMSNHRDASYTFGGRATHTLLMYLTGAPEGDIAGGATVFESGERVVPAEGDAALFSTELMHYAEPAHGWRKIILACEVVERSA